jgi:hypothetical protein
VGRGIGYRYSGCIGLELNCDSGSLGGICYRSGGRGNS